MPSSGDALLENAKALAYNDHRPFDVEHVFVEALDHFDRYPEIRDMLPRVLSDPLRAVWIGNLTGALTRLAPSDYMRGVATTRLQGYVDNLRANADAAHHELTAARILWTLLAKDDETEQILKNVHLNGQQADRIALMTILGQIISPAPPPPPPGSQPPASSYPPNPVNPTYPTSPPAPGPTNEDRARAAAAERELTTSIEPYEDIHIQAIKVNQFLTELGKSVTTNEVVIAHGPNGSLTDVLGQVLSHRVKNRGEFFGAESPLQQFEHVYIFSLRGLSRWVLDNNFPYPALILELAKQHALNDKAILMLNNMQVLHDPKVYTDAARVSLLRQLSNRGKAPIFGIFHESAAEHPAVDVKFDLSNVLPINIPHEDAAQTIELLKTYYYPRWLQQGFAFANDAFDLAVQLEPGIWVDSRRKTLPLAAVALADGTIVTARAGLLLQEARGAIDSLKEIAAKEQDAARGNAALAAVVKQAHTLIEARLHRVTGPLAIFQEPFVAKDAQGRTRLTKEHVLANLFCKNISEFHYPGHRPVDGLDD